MTLDDLFETVSYDQEVDWRARPELGLETLGGSGSGNFGHVGRPGETGGSGPSVGGIAARLHEAGGGFTYSVITKHQPTTGFAVAAHKDTEFVVDKSKVSGVLLAQYVKKHYALLKQKGNYLGGWHDPKTGNVYLDVTTHVMLHKKAEALGRAGQQIAYFDLAKQREVRIHHGRHAGTDDRRIGGRSADRRGLGRSNQTVDWDRADRPRDRRDAGNTLLGLSNPYHDVRGRFTGPGGSSSSELEHAAVQAQVHLDNIRDNLKSKDPDRDYRVHPDYQAALIKLTDLRRQLIDVRKIESETDPYAALHSGRLDAVREQVKILGDQLGQAEESYWAVQQSTAAEIAKTTTDPNFTNYEASKHPAVKAAYARMNELEQRYSKANEELETAIVVERKNVVTRRATELADSMGFPASIIHVVDKEPTPFVVGGQEFKEAGHFDSRTQEIEINARNTYSPYMSVTRGVAAHELGHAIYHAVTKAQEREHAEIEALPAAEKHRLFDAADWSEHEVFIRGAKPEAVTELRQRFPASAAFSETWGDRYLSARHTEGEYSEQQAEDNKNRDRMIAENGHTAYAKSYWTPRAIRERGGYNTAVNETLAEVIRLQVVPYSQQTTDTTPKPLWLALAKSMREAYPKLRAAEFVEAEHPRDKEGQFAAAAIQRGEAHAVSEDDFLAYHKTGSIPSDAYKKYEDGDMSFIDRKGFTTLLDTREVNGESVEIRLEAEPAKYVKYTTAAPDAERDRMYAEYEAAAKALGTTPMMAGIDLGHGSDKYNALDAFNKRWIASGSEPVRNLKGELIYLTPDEMRAQGVAEHNYTVAAFVGDKAIGYAGDEFGASGAYVARQYQRHGIGTTLLHTYLDRSGRLAKGTKMGQMTHAGQQLVRAVHRRIVVEASKK